MATTTFLQLSISVNEPGPSRDTAISKDTEMKQAGCDFSVELF